MSCTILVLLLLTACSRPEAHEETVTPALAETAPPVETPTDADPDAVHGRFIVARGGDTLRIEEFSRYADRVESRITAPGSPATTAITCKLAHDATISRVEASVTAGESDLRTVTVDIANGQAIMSARGGPEGPQQALIDVAEGTMAIPIDGSIVAIEQIIRRARDIGGSPVQVPILPPSMKPHQVTVEIGESMAIVRGTEITIDAEIDAEGNITSANDMRDGLTITRSAQ